MGDTVKDYLQQFIRIAESCGAEATVELARKLVRDLDVHYPAALYIEKGGDFSINIQTIEGLPEPTVTVVGLTGKGANKAEDMLRHAKAAQKALEQFIKELEIY